MYLCDSSFPVPSDRGRSVVVEDIVAHCGEYVGADTRRSVFQLTVTCLLLVLTGGVMFHALAVSYYWVVLVLVLPAAGLLTRIFIFQHDCGHGSFFCSKRANDWTGRCLSLLTWTPYDFWRRAHNMHHATSGDLDRRSIGGIDTITVREYRAMSGVKRFFYRLYRNPFMLLILGTPFYVLIGQRFVFNQPTNFYEGYKTLSTASIWRSILYTNVSLFLFYGGFVWLFGVHFLLTAGLPVLVVTTWIGGWLFYIQHQFEETYWARNEDWDVHEAALMGSSYYDLHPVLQWFTGNIGLHHIHHLCSRIPNYKLQECMDARPELRKINRITLRKSLECLHFRLWDEDTGRLVRFADIPAV